MDEERRAKLFADPLAAMRQDLLHEIAHFLYVDPLDEIGPLRGTERVLDVASGTGGWVLDVAQAHPDIEIAGIEQDRSMALYAITQAHAQGISNASFEGVDLGQPLDFADASFDLIHARFLLDRVPSKRLWRCSPNAPVCCDPEASCNGQRERKAAPALPTRQ